MNAKQDVKELSYNEDQYKLFEAAEPDPVVADPERYWDTIARALAHAQDQLPAENSRALFEPVQPHKKSVAQLVADHFSYTVQRWAVRERSGFLIWETREHWADRVISDLNARACLMYWHKAEVEALYDALWEAADMARFVKASQELVQ